MSENLKFVTIMSGPDVWVGVFWVAMGGVSVRGRSETQVSDAPELASRWPNPPNQLVCLALDATATTVTTLGLWKYPAVASTERSELTHWPMMITRFAKSLRVPRHKDAGLPPWRGGFSEPLSVALQR